MNLITFFKTVKCQVLPTLAFVFAIGFNVSAQVSDEGCMDPNACNYDPNATQDVGSCEFFIDCAGVCGGWAYDCVTSECGEIYPLMNFGYEVSSCPGVDVLEGNNQSSDEPFVYFIINSGADNNYDLTVGSNTQEIVIYVGSGNGNSVDITYTGYAPNVSQLIGGGNGASWNLIDNNIYGCMDVAACNYDDTATGGDSSCIFDVDECGVCNGDNSTCPDCAGVVNGDALIQGYFFDADGDGLGYGKAVQYCSGSVPTCTDGDGDGVETGCWVLNDYDSYPDCYSNNVDCNGTCDGYEVVNGCGECGGDEWALWYADIDGDGLGDPNAEISSCDYIEGYVIWNNSDPDDNCFSNAIDECGVCDGDNSTCTDCAGLVNGEAVEDCAGVCGGTSVIDECGVCGGDNSTCADCCGVPNGDGTTCDGVCGACNDDTSCYGCTYTAATNYDSTATIDDGSCLYAVCDITSDNQAVYDGAYAAGIASVVCPDGGSSCPGDLDNDGAVATSDLLMFLSAFGDTCDSGDVIDEVAPTITSGGTGTDLVDNSEEGQTVYTITADANDGGTIQSYAIGGTDASALAVDASTGVVSLTADPDYETQSSFSFTVTATDETATSAATTVTFSITNVDDIDPTITSGSTGIDLIHESVAGQTVYTITADANDGGTISSYAIGGTDAGLLTLTGNVVTLNAAPDYGTKSSYSFTVTASDATGTSAATTVTFSVNFTEAQLNIAGASSTPPDSWYYTGGDISGVQGVGYTYYNITYATAKSWLQNQTSNGVNTYFDTYVADGTLRSWSWHSTGAGSPLQGRLYFKTVQLYNTPGSPISGIATGWTLGIPAPWPGPVYSGENPSSY
jgi:hypothetical protein